MKTNLWITSFLAASTLWAGSALAQPGTAHVTVEGAWVRATVPGQQGTGAFMRLKAQEPLELVGVRSPAAQVSELHEMRMEGDVMRMRAISGLPLPQGKTVELKPGGYHLMLQQLNAPLVKGTEVPVTLEFKAPDGTLSRLQLSVPVTASAPQGTGAPAGHGKGHGHGH